MKKRKWNWLTWEIITWCKDWPWRIVMAIVVGAISTVVFLCFSWIDTVYYDNWPWWVILANTVGSFFYLKYLSTMHYLHGLKDWQKSAIKSYEGYSLDTKMGLPSNYVQLITDCPAEAPELIDQAERINHLVEVKRNRMNPPNQALLNAKEKMKRVEAGLESDILTIMEVEGR